jgi:hypothetical protein
LPNPGHPSGYDSALQDHNPLTFRFDGLLPLRLAEKHSAVGLPLDRAKSNGQVFSR